MIVLGRLEDVVSRLEAADQQIATASVRADTLRRLRPQVDDVLFELGNLLPQLADRLDGYVRLIEVLKRYDITFADSSYTAQWADVSSDESVRLLRRLSEIARADAAEA